MSWLRLRGIQYHCTQCKKTISVDFQGGTQRTMVSGPVIESQAELVTKLRLRDHDRMAYFHEEGLCESCGSLASQGGHDDIATTEQVKHFQAAMQKMMAAATRHEKKLKDLVAAWLERWVGSINLGTLRDVAPREFEATLAKAAQAAPADREKLVRDYLETAGKVIEKQGLAALAADPKARAALRRYDKSALARVTNARTTLAACGSYRLSPESVRRAVSLNPYLRSEYSVRAPVKSTPATRFFFKQPLQRERAEAEIRRAEGLIGVSLTTGDLNAKVMLRLFDLVRK